MQERRKEKGVEWDEGRMGRRDDEIKGEKWEGGKRREKEEDDRKKKNNTDLVILLIFKNMFR